MSNKINDIIIDNQKEHLESLEQDVKDYRKTLEDDSESLANAIHWANLSRENLLKSEKELEDYKKEIGYEDHAKDRFDLDVQEEKESNNPIK